MGVMEDGHLRVCAGGRVGSNESGELAQLTLVGKLAGWRIASGKAREFLFERLRSKRLQSGIFFCGSHPLRKKTRKGWGTQILVNTGLENALAGRIFHVDGRVWLA